MSKFSKYLFIVSFVALVLAGIVFAEAKQSIVPSLAGSAKLEVDYLDVGQGDSIYVRTPDNVDMLIDGGPDKKVLSELGKVMSFWDHEIDVLILTHPHADHVSGLVEVLRRYKVKQIYYTGVLHTAPDYLAWLAEIRKQNIPLYIVDSEKEIALGAKTKLDFLYPTENLVNKKVADLNETSIVAKLIYGQTSFLFTGDTQSANEREMLEANVDVSATVLKVAHHGSKTSSLEEFLQKVNPQIAVIQSGLDNEFGHPHLVIVERLKRLGIQILRNDQLGLIRLFSDGIKVTGY